MDQGIKQTLAVSFLLIISRMVRVEEQVKAK